MISSVASGTAPSPVPVLVPVPDNQLEAPSNNNSAGNGNVFIVANIQGSDVSGNDNSGNDLASSTPAPGPEHPLEAPTKHSAGNEGCPCIDATGILESIAERSCTTSSSDGQIGVMLTAAGPCVPHSYGSGGCLRHDLIHDPKCEMADAGEPGNPDYCLRSWCYVDAESCRRTSLERVYRANFFSHDTGVNLFYSYTTCNSSAEDWNQYNRKHALGGRGGMSIKAIVPAYSVPVMYKRNSAGQILLSTDSGSGSEYYDSSVPFEGVFMNYLDTLMDIAEGDVNITYTYGSDALKNIYSSKYTAAVQEIEDGLVDMAIGRFWITGERLKMTAFTVPIYYDKTFLVIKNPALKSSVWTEAGKILAPFTMGVWALIATTIAVTAFLSVWFSTYGKRMRQSKRSERHKKSLYARFALDECLHKGIFFCSAGVEQDASASLPQKMLMFGFGFFILIVVSSFVANLAAFLTQSVDPHVGTMEAVVGRGMSICAHPALQDDLEVAWPTAKFVFAKYDKGAYIGMVTDLTAGKCDVLAASESDVTSDYDVTKVYCENNVVFTDSLIVETAVAFPIRPGLASGLSYWINHGEKKEGVSFKSALAKYNTMNGMQSCNLDFSVKAESDTAKIRPENLSLPFIFFLFFAVLAILLQLCHQRDREKGITRSFYGRHSTIVQHPRPAINRRMNAFEEDSEAQSPQMINAITDAEVACSLSEQEKFLDRSQREESHDNCNGILNSRAKGIQGGVTFADQS